MVLLLTKYKSLLIKNRESVKNALSERVGGECTPETMQWLEGQLYAYNRAIEDIDRMLKCAKEHLDEFNFEGV